MSAGEDITEEAVQTEGHLLPKMDASTQCSQPNYFSVHSISFDDESIKFYTGLESFSRFMFVFQSLGQAVDQLNYYCGTKPNLPVIDQFFCTLVKLRQHKTNFQLSKMFSIAEKSVTNIFVTWINFLDVEFADICWWISSDLVQFFSPSDFFDKFPTTRVIVDGTECPVQKPKDPVAQQASFSTYKNRNTVKVLVGASLVGWLPTCLKHTADLPVTARYVNDHI